MDEEEPQVLHCEKACVSDLSQLGEGELLLNEHVPIADVSHPGDKH